MSSFVKCPFSGHSGSRQKPELPPLQHPSRRFARCAAHTAAALTEASAAVDANYEKNVFFSSAKAHGEHLRALGQMYTCNPSPGLAAPSCHGRAHTVSNTHELNPDSTLKNISKLNA